MPARNPAFFAACHRNITTQAQMAEVAGQRPLPRPNAPRGQGRTPQLETEGGNRIRKCAEGSGRCELVVETSMPNGGVSVTAARRLKSISNHHLSTLFPFGQGSVSGEASGGSPAPRHR
jgi:hypothetical protein